MIFQKNNFPKNSKEAIAIQKTLAEQVVRKDDFQSINRVAGMDVSHTRFDPKKMVYGSIVVLDNHSKCLIDHSYSMQKQDFPYITGLLSFREAPVLMDAYAGLTLKPDLIMVDGQGISHPRGLGIASHLGLFLDIPTIGIGKSILVGKPLSPLGDIAGSQTPLIYKNEVIGMLLRTRTRANPIIISVGHRIGLESAVNFAKEYLYGYRIPKPTREAHIAANAFRRQQQNLSLN